MIGKFSGSISDQQAARLLLDLHRGDNFSEKEKVNSSLAPIISSDLTGKIGRLVEKMKGNLELLEKRKGMFISVCSPFPAMEEQPDLENIYQELLTRRIDLVIEGPNLFEVAEESIKVYAELLSEMPNISQDDKMAKCAVAVHIDISLKVFNQAVRTLWKKPLFSNDEIEQSSRQFVRRFSKVLSEGSATRFDDSIRSLKKLKPQGHEFTLCNSSYPAYVVKAFAWLRGQFNPQLVSSERRLSGSQGDSPKRVRFSNPIMGQIDRILASENLELESKQKLFVVMQECYGQREASKLLRAIVGAKGSMKSDDWRVKILTYANLQQLKDKLNERMSENI